MVFHTLQNMTYTHVALFSYLCNRFHLWIFGSKFLVSVQITFIRNYHMTCKVIYICIALLYWPLLTLTFYANFCNMLFYFINHLTRFCFDVLFKYIALHCSICFKPFILYLLFISFEFQYVCDFWVCISEF